MQVTNGPRTPDPTARAHRREVAVGVADLIGEADADLQELAADITELYRQTIPGYDQVPRHRMEQNTAEVLQLVIVQLQAGPSPRLDRMEGLARIWARHEIPLELVSHSLQLGARRLFTVIKARAQARSLDPALIDEMQDLAWEWATAYAAAIHSVMQERAVAGASRQADLVRHLVEGGLSAGRLEAHAKELRLDPAHRYVVACAVRDDTTTSSELLAFLRLRGSAPGLPMVDAVIDDHLVAVMAVRPTGSPARGVIALGPPAVPADLAPAYRGALRALDLAHRFDRGGLVDLASLGPLPLLGLDEDAGAHLAEKYLPLFDIGPSGREVLDTVAVFLDNGQRVDDTAAALFVHRNTVRNRLLRFTELSGLDLDRTDDLVLGWWLVHRDRAARVAADRPGRPAGPGR